MFPSPAPHLEYGTINREYAERKNGNRKVTTNNIFLCNELLHYKTARVTSGFIREGNQLSKKGFSNPKPGPR